LTLSSSLVVIFTIPHLIPWSNYCMFLTYFIWYEYFILILYCFYLLLQLQIQGNGLRNGFNPFLGLAKTGFL
jgi:hypothetical protein